MLELSVIAPCFNEEGNIDTLVSRVRNMFEANSINGELVLVNDASKDNTQKKIEAASLQYKNVVGVQHFENGGITEGWASGLKKSSGKYVVTIDADMQYRPEDIPLLYHEIKQNGYDLVQGWRAKSEKASLIRRLLSWGLSALLNLLFLKNVQDIKSGFVIYRREVLEDVLKDKDKFLTFQHFFILRAFVKKYRFHQVPITFDPRTQGESFIKNPFLFSCKVLQDLPKAIYVYGIVGRFNPEKI